MKIKYLILIGLLAFTSCNDFLEENPKSVLPQDKFFKEPSHAWAAVNQLYRTGIQNLAYAGSAYNGPKLMSGSFMAGFFDNPSYKGQEQFLVQSQSLMLNAQTSAGYLDGIWDPCYRAIAEANFAIEQIPTTPGLDDETKKKLIAEARFFRAYNYFHLVRYFGDVPLVVDSKNKDLYLPKSASNNVYQLIVSDLEKACAEGNLADKPMCKNGFRVSKGSVNALLASVYLTMSGFPVKDDHYADAAKVAREVINSGNYKLITNSNTTDKSAYNVIRTSDVEDEYMYQVEYKAGISSNFWMPVYCFPTGASGWADIPFKYSITCDAFLPRQEFLAMYDPNEDIRIQEKQFFHSSFRYNNGEVHNFPTMPYLWFEETALFVTGQQEMDAKLYRYAEVLLIAAEAIAEKEGVTAEAVNYLAQVRSRASLTGKTIVQVAATLSGLSKQQFIEEVWKERLREFPLEFKIWDDIQRTRKIMVTDTKSKGTITFKNVIGATNTWGAVFQLKDLLYPISANEIQRNKNLKQNEGY